MKIWKLDFEVDKYDSLVPAEDCTADDYAWFREPKRKENWKKLPVKRLEPEKNLSLGDAPGFNFPIFSKRAVDILWPVMKESVEKLELQFDEGEYYGINVITVLDVIDYSKSKYITFDDGKRIMVFQKYAFRYCEEIIRNNIFKIVDEPTCNAFVTEKFKKVVEENNLSGFDFILVWDSEQEDG